MREICRYCEYARQAGKRNQTSVVGCAKAFRGELSVYDIDRSVGVYSGWVYSGRRPGDESKSDTLGKGALLNNATLVDSIGSCRMWEPANIIYGDKP